MGITRGELIRVAKITMRLINLRIGTNNQIETFAKDRSITRVADDCFGLMTLLDVGNKWSKVVFVA